ncbi:hypothetical protein THIX_40085 [Thiomonas sp. X19]|nr:hypothetical protein THIX_40085 [Thiomonas sp. X19]
MARVPKSIHAKLSRAQAEGVCLNALALAAGIHTQFARWMRAQPASQTLSGTALHPLSKQLLYPHRSSPAYRRGVWVRTCGSTWMARPQGPSPRGTGTRPGNAGPASLESAMTRLAARKKHAENQITRHIKDVLAAAFDLHKVAEIRKLTNIFDVPCLEIDTTGQSSMQTLSVISARKRVPCISRRCKAQVWG